MVEVVVYGVPDKFCESMQSSEERAEKIKEVLERKFENVSFHYIDLTKSEINQDMEGRIEEGGKLPIVFIDGKLVAEGRLSLSDIIKTIQIHG